jgi:hypothetical protein
MNRIGEQLMGYSQSEILEMNLTELIAPEYRVLVEKLIARTLDAQTQTGDEIELITKHGRRIMVDINTHPINQDGKTFEIQGVAARSARPHKNLPWESQSLIEDSQTPRINEESKGMFLRSYDDAANSGLTHKPSSRLGRSQYSL